MFLSLSLSLSPYYSYSLLGFQDSFSIVATFCTHFYSRKFLLGSRSRYGEVGNRIDWNFSARAPVKPHEMNQHGAGMQKFESERKRGFEARAKKDEGEVHKIFLSDGVKLIQNHIESQNFLCNSVKFG